MGINFSVMKQTEQRVICILGMHRSGTSCLAGSLEEAGVFLGDVSRKNPYNLKGNLENLKIMKLHDNLLIANGGSWDSPPKLVIWSKAHKIRRDKILKEHENIPLWGFKDPRTLFTIEGWMEVLSNISFVGIYRNPLSVAQSLQRRDKFSIEKGVNLWLVYNKKLLEYHNKYSFPIISFDLEKEISNQKIALLLSRLELPFPTERLNFFDPGLRHFEKEYDIPLNKDANNLYEELKKLSL